MSEQAIIEYNGAATLPEGLHLAYSYHTLPQNYEPAIYDAQDMVWVHFPDHDTEDPLEWFLAIMLRTVNALGITVAFNKDGEQITVAEFLNEWASLHEGEPGFTT